MILYIGSLIFFSITIVLHLFGGSINIDPLYVISFIVLIIAVITQGSMYANQCVAIEKIKENKEKEKIYEEKADTLIEECKVYLKDIYPNIEKELFNTMASADALLLNFPEIKSHETVVKLVDMINRDRKDVYYTRLSSAILKREIRARKRIAHFWIYSPMIPEYVQDEEKV